MATKTPPAPTPPALQLVQVNPAALLFRDQAREDATPDEGLIASIRQHGILQPPIVGPGPKEGTYYVLFGHRRVGGAIAAGLEQITVILREEAPLDAEALTLEEQLVENERRKQLTSKDLAAGFSKLTLFGLRPEDIAASVGDKPERVRAGLKIVQSPNASELVEANPIIDFEQAAIIADFEDHPKIQKKLIETATERPENFPRDVEQARADRRLRDVVDSIRAALAERGVPVLQEVTYSTASYWTGTSSKVSTGAPLNALADADGNDLTPESHQLCDGHAAVIQRVSTWYLDNEAQPIEPFYVCTNWEGFGHQKRAAAERTPEQLEQEAERQRAIQEAAARQAVIDANTSARHAWLHGYLTTGRLRPTASHFDLIAAAIAASIDFTDRAPAHVVMSLLTGTDWPRVTWQDDSTADALVAGIRDGSLAALRVIVADAVALFEDHLHYPDAVRYFAALESWGYTLTDTDREHLAKATAAAMRREPDGTDDEAEDDE
ncbi:ParB/RepB/Spo0J family partition protein [Microbacterium sp.]|jgi:ParB/RepB/Spo0J family partition protein|uniref:ParB/RepB/Spo0J family partition protein n=1 Tax=Microbacterium sp. TaxID=51671 RepID=UPI0037C8E5D1